MGWRRTRRVKGRGRGLARLVDLRALPVVFGLALRSGLSEILQPPGFVIATRRVRRREQQKPGGRCHKSLILYDKCYVGAVGTT